jgi:hypothetical protein
MSRNRIRELDIPLWARNRALHYLAGSYRLSDDIRHQLTQVVHGYTGRCDDDAARKGMEWMRAKALDRHHRPTGMVLLLLNDLVGVGKQVRQNEKGGTMAAPSG